MSPISFTTTFIRLRSTMASLGHSRILTFKRDRVDGTWHCEGTKSSGKCPLYPSAPRSGDENLGRSIIPIEAEYITENVTKLPASTFADATTLQYVIQGESKDLPQAKNLDEAIKRFSACRGTGSFWVGTKTTVSGTWTEDNVRYGRNSFEGDLDILIATTYTPTDRPWGHYRRRLE
jgi:hypothetical protein